VLLSLRLTCWADCWSTSGYSQINVAIWNACKQHHDTNKHRTSNITANIPPPPHTHTIKRRSYLPICYSESSLLGCATIVSGHTVPQHLSHPKTQHHIPEDLNLQNCIQKLKTKMCLGCCEDNLTLFPNHRQFRGGLWLRMPLSFNLLLSLSDELCQGDPVHTMKAHTWA
jgi:hypothetical protein